MVLIFSQTNHLKFIISTLKIRLIYIYIYVYYIHIRTNICIFAFNQRPYTANKIRLSDKGQGYRYGSRFLSFSLLHSANPFNHPFSVWGWWWSFKWFTVSGWRNPNPILPLHTRCQCECYNIIYIRISIYIILANLKSLYRPSDMYVCYLYGRLGTFAWSLSLVLRLPYLLRLVNLKMVCVES